MKVTIVGCGDAFCSEGRAHTCFRVESAKGAAIVDFGAGSIASWKRLGLSFNPVDLIAISHFHGDHFGGLPFLLLDCQFVERRTRALTLAGPPGIAARLDQLCEALFSGRTDWSFPLEIVEVTPGAAPIELCGFTLGSVGVTHSAASIPTALRLGDGSAVFAYSGDTAWTDALLDVSADADLFLCECYSGEAPVPYHLDWPTLRANLPRLSARRIGVTHMSPGALARRAEMERAGLEAVYDGQIFDIEPRVGRRAHPGLQALR